MGLRQVATRQVALVVIIRMPRRCWLRPFCDAADAIGRSDGEFPPLFWCLGKAFQGEARAPPLH
eukprot:8934374-Lingulodinium_polyedra.AAC.1